MFTNIINTFKDNMFLIISVYSIYALAESANIILSIYYNIYLAKVDKFDWKKLLLGIIKMVVLFVSSTLIISAITGITFLVNDVELFKELGIDISSEGMALINIAAIVSVYWNAIKKYLTEANETLRQVVMFQPVVDKHEEDSVDPEINTIINENDIEDDPLLY